MSSSEKEENLYHLYRKVEVIYDGYYEVNKPVTLPYISFMFIEMKFSHCNSCLMFSMKSMYICND